MLHDEDYLGKQIHGIDTWLYYFDLLGMYKFLLDRIDRLNSMKPGPGRLQFLR